MMLILSPNGCVLETVIFGDGEAVPADTWYPAYSYSTYSRSFDSAWVGRNRDELVDALGPPDAIYEARPKFMSYWKAGIPAYTYVYWGASNSPRHCVDAYVIEESSSTIIRYYCR